ncbi:MAG TPA: S53 family peptidase [Acidobacteriaceae bacterium]|nr:S53 family peptidase [Acidobacteriaceae bacterium]
MTASRFTPALLVVAGLFCAGPGFFALSQAQQPQARLSTAIANTSRATLVGSQPPRAHLAHDAGAVDPATPLQSITMYFSRTSQQQSDLDALIAAQQNPASPQYHQWLTPAEFGSRFGVADADIAKTESWLESQGFTVQSVSPSRNSITFSGTAATAASAFGAPLHHYSLNGENHIAPSADLTLPSALAGIVADVRGLSDYRPHAHVRKGNGAAFKPNFTSGQTGNHFLTPGDIAVIYDIKAAYSAGYNGSGQTIAIMGQSAISSTDVTRFQTGIGQTANAPTSILVPSTGISQVYSGDESESDLDVEYATGIAPGATIDFVYVGADATASVFDSLTWAIQNRIAPILNISYGECEAALGQSQYNSLNATLQQAAAQGQTIVSAAGDDGSSDCYDPSSVTTIAQTEGVGVDFPSSSQYVTGVGGTEFPAADVTASTSSTTYFSANGTSDVIVSALSYIPEMAWNDDSVAGISSGLSAGGGGISMFTPAPSWQTGVPGIPAGTSFRLLPDVALDASPNNAPYAYCSSDSTAWASGQQGSCTTGLRDSSSQDLTVAGGTSFAAPIFSGMVAILGQAKGYTWQGVVNPTLYSLAANPATYATAFHDVTSGNNECNLGVTYCGTGTDVTNYAAGVGYDEATGLGSIDLNNLLTAWPKNTSTNTAKAFTLSASALTINQGSGTNGTGSGTSTVTVTPVNGYTGTVTWTVTSNSTVTGACYSIPNATVSGTSAATATLTVTVGNTSCPSGTTALLKSAGTQTAAVHSPAQPAHRSPAVPVLATLGLASLLFIGRRKRRLPALLAVVVLAGVGLGLSGCGGGSNTSCGVSCVTGGNPTQYDYTVTVIGRDTTTSSIVANTTLAFTLTVQ